MSKQRLKPNKPVTIRELDARFQALLADIPEPGEVDTTIAIDPDISGYTTVAYDAYDDWNGYENGNSHFEIDVDTALNAVDTVYDLLDNDFTGSNLFNFLNVEFNKVYYFRLNNTWSFEPNPQTIAPMLININGLVTAGDLGIEVPDMGTDYDFDAGSPANVICFYVDGTPTTEQELRDSIKWAQYPNGFAVSLPDYLAPFFNIGGMGEILSVKVGEGLHNNVGTGLPEVTVPFDPAFITAIRLRTIDFETQNSYRPDFNAVSQSEDLWLAKATKLIWQSSFDINLPANPTLSVGMGEVTLTASKAVVVSANINRGWSGKYVVTPAGFTWTFPAAYIPRPDSEVWNPAAARIIVEWDAINETEALLRITNLL